jgi:hypothetical protein
VSVVAAAWFLLAQATLPSMAMVLAMTS